MKARKTVFVLSLSSCIIICSCNLKSSPSRKLNINCLRLHRLLITVITLKVLVFSVLFDKKKIAHNLQRSFETFRNQIEY